MTALANAIGNTLLDTAVTTGYKVRLMTVNGSPGTNGTEVLNAGASTYAAQSSTWAAATGQSKTTTADIVFTGMPVCTVVGVEVWNTANTVREAFGLLTNQRTFALNDTGTFTAGSLTLAFP